MPSSSRDTAPTCHVSLQQLTLWFTARLSRTPSRQFCSRQWSGGSQSWRQTPEGRKRSWKTASQGFWCRQTNRMFSVERSSNSSETLTCACGWAAKEPLGFELNSELLG